MFVYVHVGRCPGAANVRLSLVFVYVGRCPGAANVRLSLVFVYVGRGPGAANVRLSLVFVYVGRCPGADPRGDDQEARGDQVFPHRRLPARDGTGISLRKRGARANYFRFDDQIRIKISTL